MKLILRINKNVDIKLNTYNTDNLYYFLKYLLCFVKIINK